MIKGRVKIITRNKLTGESVPVISENVIINGARAATLQRIRAVSSTDRVITYLALGTGMTAPTGTDAALETQVASAEILTWVDSGGGANPVSTASHTFEDGSGDITEAGLLYDDESLFSRALVGQGAITGATQADPVVITSVGHGRIDDDVVFIAGVQGMTEINDSKFSIAVVDDDNFQLVGEDGTGHTAYTEGGTWTLVREWGENTELDVEYALEWECD